MHAFESKWSNSLEKFKNLNLNSSLKIYTMFQMSTVKIIITLYSKI